MMPPTPRKGHLKIPIEKLKFVADRDVKRPKSSLTGKTIEGAPVVAWVDGPVKRTIRVESRSNPDRKKYYILFSDAPVNKRLYLSEDDLAEIVEE